jgi:heptosyltransferase-2
MLKTLVVGPAWVGDMIMAQSLFKAVLERSNQKMQIDVLAPRYTLSLLQRMPEVHEALSMPSISHGELALGKRYKAGQSLRARQYDQAIILPNSWKSALIPFWANIPKRTGWVGECRFGLLNDVRRLDKTVLSSMTSQYGALAFPKGQEQEAKIIPQRWRPALSVTPDDVQKTLDKFGIILDKNRPILALCPGAAFGSAKRWPEQYFAELANEMMNQGWEVWLFGSAGEKAVGNKIQSLSDNRCRDFVGTTSLPEAIDLLSVVTKVVSNDSGLMHIAAALQRSVIAIYGPTPAEFAPPLSTDAQILQVNLPCRPCQQRECPLGHHHCMKMIKPLGVLSKIVLSEL